jgi:hypothetical protein
LETVNLLLEKGHTTVAPTCLHAPHRLVPSFSHPSRAQRKLPPATASPSALVCDMTGCRSDGRSKFGQASKWPQVPPPISNSNMIGKEVAARKSVGAPSHELGTDRCGVTRTPIEWSTQHINLQDTQRSLTKVEQHRLARSRLASLERHRGMQAVRWDRGRLTMHACI